MKTQPLSDLPSTLYRASLSDSETDYSIESDELDSDSGYGISERRTSYCCPARTSEHRRQLSVQLDDCTSIPLSPTDRLLLVPHPWPPTSVSCSREVADTRQTVSTCTTTQSHHEVAQTANVRVNTAVTDCQLTTQPAEHGVSSHSPLSRCSLAKHPVCCRVIIKHVTSTGLLFGPDYVSIFILKRISIKMIYLTDLKHVVYYTYFFTLIQHCKALNDRTFYHKVLFICVNTFYTFMLLLSLQVSASCTITRVDISDCQQNEPGLYCRQCVFSRTSYHHMSI